MSTTPSSSNADEETVVAQSLRLALPPLLHQGIASRVREVRVVSLRAVLAVCEVAGSMLRPHIAEVIGVLMEGLSTLEPAELSYLQFHAASLDMTAEQLESARVGIARASPLSAAIDRCVTYIDKSSVRPVVDRLTDLLRAGVGMQSLVAASRVIVTLCSPPYVHRIGTELTAVSASLCKVLCLGLTNPSPVLRKAYATALANVCRVAKRKRVSKVINYVTSLMGVPSNEDSGNQQDSQSHQTDQLPEIALSNPRVSRLAASLFIRELTKASLEIAKQYAVCTLY